MPLAPRFGEYVTGGCHEFLMSFGPQNGPQLLVIPPLLEELNRTRKLLSDLMRTLAAHGIGTHLPDLPGTGESERVFEAVSWSDWEVAVHDIAKIASPDAVVSFRGGCLLDHAAGCEKTIRFAPTEGKRLIRDLIRSRAVTDTGFDSATQKAVFETGPTMLGGYPVSANFASAMRNAEPKDAPGVHTIRLTGDRGDAEIHIEGSPLWHRAEPSGSPEMVRRLADIIAEWL